MTSNTHTHTQTDIQMVQSSPQSDKTPCLTNNTMVQKTGKIPVQICEIKTTRNLEQSPTWLCPAP